MKDIILRFWNTIKIPLVVLIVVMITMVVSELNKTGDFTTVLTWDFWSGAVYTLMLMALPALSASLDKWLRNNGIYLDQIFNGFKLPSK